mgnify:CR=1 FL=1
MVIDMHTHAFPEALAPVVLDKLQEAARAKIHIAGTPQALQASMKRARVDYSVILPVATNARQPHKLNLAAAEINEHSSETGLISFGAMHPDDPNWQEELRFLAQHGFRGIKLHPAYQGPFFDDIRYLRIVGRAAELGLLITVHAGLDIGVPGPAKVTPDNTLRVLRETGADKLILAHMGGWMIWDQVLEQLAGQPVYLDTSFSFGRVNPHPDYPRTEDELRLGDTSLLLRLIRAHGADRVLFGSDSPWGDQGADLDLLRSLDLTGEELRRIEGENARTLLGL